MNERRRYRNYLNQQFNTTKPNQVWASDVTPQDARVLYPLAEKDGQNVLGEAAIIKRLGDNDYLADYNGVRCHAAFNPTAGRYYVDDVYGVVHLPTTNGDTTRVSIMLVFYAIS